jgi:hypothetical protein
MDVFSLVDCSDDSTDIVAVFDDGVADGEFFQRNFVTDRHVLIDDSPKLAVVLCHHAKQIRPGNEILDDHNADVVPAIMYQ